MKKLKVVYWASSPLPPKMLSCRLSNFSHCKYSRHSSVAAVKSFLLDRSGGYSVSATVSEKNCESNFPAGRDIRRLRLVQLSVEINECPSTIGCNISKLKPGPKVAPENLVVNIKSYNVTLSGLAGNVNRLCFCEGATVFKALPVMIRYLSA